MSEQMDTARAFADALQGEVGDDLRSAVLYGSAARGDFSKGSSDLNVLVIVSRLGVNELSRIAGPASDWIEAGNPPPMLLEEGEWRNSADVFPIEYTDIRDAHAVLAGIDPFEGVVIRRQHLRLQLEHELRSRKIQLREGYIAAAEKPDQLGRLLSGTISTFLTYFRALHRLAGREIPAGGEALIRSTATLIGFEPAAMIEVLAAKKSGKSAVTPLQGKLAQGYLDAVEKATRWLDQYQPLEEESTEV